MRNRQHTSHAVHEGGSLHEDQESGVGCTGVVWPFPNQPPDHEPLYKLPFNPENYEDAPV